MTLGGMTWEEWFNLPYEKLLQEFERLKAERLHILERAAKALSFEDEYWDFQMMLLLRLEVLARKQLNYLAAIAGAAPPEPPRTPPVITYGTPVSKLDRLITTSQAYLNVVEWEVPALYRGELFDVEMAASDYSRTLFRLVLANKEQWADKYLPTAFAQRFENNRLTELMKVTIQAKSADGQQITAYGAISGNLFAP